MATDDRQVLVTGQAPVPAGFLIPGNGQIKPKSMNAVFDGTNAAGAFMPALEIISDAGIVVARVPAPQVAAGASAEVTWAPFLRAAQALAGIGTLTFAYSGPHLPFKVCPAGMGTLLSGDPTSFFTSSSTDFAQGTYVSAPNTYYGTKVLTPGHYLGLAYFAVLKSGGGTPLVGAHYSVQPQLTDGDIEESFFLFGDTNYMAVSNSDYPISTLYGDLGTVTAPATEFRHPWIFTLSNNGASDLQAYVATLLIKLDSNTTSLT